VSLYIFDVYRIFMKYVTPLCGGVLCTKQKKMYLSELGFLNASFSK
jgi:hypothetical protein